MKGNTHIDAKLLLIIAIAFIAMMFFAGCPSPKQVIISKNTNDIKNIEVDAGLFSFDGGLTDADASVLNKEEQNISEKAKLFFNDGISLMFIDKSRSLDNFNRALELEPNFLKALNSAGMIFLWDGRFTDAENNFKKALIFKPDYFPAMINLAESMIRKGELPSAVSYINEMILKYPNSLVLKNKLAEIFILEGKIDEAIKLSMDILKMDEKDTGAMLNLAEGYYLQKKYELAQMALDNVKEINPKIPMIYILDGYICLATRCLDMQNKQEAISSFKKALEIRDDLPEIHCNLGFIFNEAGDYENAIQELNKALNYKPDFNYARLNLANSYRGMRMYEEAENEYNKVLKTGKESGKVTFDLGILYLDMEREFKYGGDSIDRLKKAKQYFEKYLADNKISKEEEVKVTDYIKEADKKIRQKEADIEREKKRKLREAEDKKKKEEAAKKAEESKKAEEELKNKEKALEKAGPLKDQQGKPVDSYIEGNAKAPEKVLPSVESSDTGSKVEVKSSGESEKGSANSIK